MNRTVIIFFTLILFVSFLSFKTNQLQASAIEETLPKKDWSFNGMFGTFDRGSLQRGLQVYIEVCSSCHSLKLVSYRHLSGIGLNEKQIKEKGNNFKFQKYMGLLLINAMESAGKSKQNIVATEILRYAASNTNISSFFVKVS